MIRIDMATAAHRADFTDQTQSAESAGKEKNAKWQKPSSTDTEKYFLPEQIDGGPEIIVGTPLDEENERDLPEIEILPDEAKK